MARIRHIAICSNRQEELARFYRETFELTEVVRHISAQSGNVAIYLSDGEVNLAFIPASIEPEGINHFGFQVEDVNAVAQTALANGAQAGAQSVPQDGRQNEAYIADPEGQRIDLSSAGWNIAGSGKGHVRHVALMSVNPSQLAEFYSATFGLHEVFRRDREGGAVYLSDGYINLALLPRQVAEAKNAPPGINHFGFHVDEVPGMLERAYANGAAPSDYALPRDGRFAETFVFDPIGLRVDLSQAGWRVTPKNDAAVLQAR